MQLTHTDDPTGKDRSLPLLQCQMEPFPLTALTIITKKTLEVVWILDAFMKVKVCSLRNGV